MTLKEFSMKYQVPYYVVYESSYKVHPESPMLRDRDFPEEGLRKAIIELADERIQKHRKVLRQQIEIREKVSV